MQCSQNLPKSNLLTIISSNYSNYSLQVKKKKGKPLQIHTLLLVTYYSPLLCFFSGLPKQAGHTGLSEAGPEASLSP